MTKWEASDELRKARLDARSEKYCLHPSASPGSCDNVIKAHSVQRRGGLSRIAKCGQVYRYSADVFDYGRHQGRLVHKLIGIRNASTFPGFCASHDNATFEPIDNEHFSAAPEQCFLLGYRAISRAIFTKRSMKKLIRSFRRTIGEVPLNRQVAIQGLFDAVESVGELALSNLESHKSAFDRVLLSRKYSDIRYYVLLLKNTPDVLCSGTLYPESDFEGGRIQSMTTGGRLDLITYSVIATDKGGAVIFAWEAGSDRCCARFIRSLDSIPDDLISHAMVRFLFTYCENKFLSPTWWDGLSDECRKALEVRYGLPASDTECLLDDGLRVVSGRIISRQSNVI